MSLVAWAAWVLAVGVPATSGVLGLTRLDENRLGAIRARSFGPLLMIPPLALWASVVAADRLAFDRPSAAVVDPGSWWILPPLLVALGTTWKLLWPAGARRGPRPTEGRPLRLVSLNIESGASDPAGVARQLASLDGDVVLIQEYTPPTRDGCHDAGLVAAYPYAFEDPRDGWFGSAVLSRHPIEAAEVTTIGHRPMVAATIRVGDRPVEVVNVHAQAPVHDHDVEPWRTAFEDLTAVADRATAHGRAVLLAGDWNSTRSHRPMRRITAGPLRDARRGEIGLRRTWPVGRRHPPLLCLDHVVHSGEISARSVTEVTVGGTDHRAVVAELSVSQP